MGLSLNAVSATELDSLENISKELVDIRQEISNLHDEITFKKESFNDRIRSYSNQKTDLDVKISRSELNLKELERELTKLKEENAQRFESYDEVLPILKSAFESLKQDIENSIPFKRKQRLQALHDIEHRLNAKLITPNKAANQLWAFVEDELVMGRSSGIYNEVIQVKGEDKLVKVLRLGKVAMFYKDPDEQYGLVKKNGDSWEQSQVVGEDSVRQLDYLFDSYAKNIRSGLFKVPNFLPLAD